MRQRVIIAIVLIGAAVAAKSGWREGNAKITDGAFTNPGARSIGLGFGRALRRFQIDFGTHISDRAVVGSVSIVSSF